MDLGYDESCRIVALSVEKEAPSRVGGAFLALRGESVSMDDREVQHAWRLEEGWSGIESHSDPDGEWTVRDLEAWKTLSIRSGLLLSPAPSPAEETVTDVDLLARLVVRGDGDGGRWVRMESVAGPVLVYRDGDWGSGGYLAGWLAFLDGEKPVHLPKLGFHGTDSIVAQIRGRFLLVSAQYTGARPRLYDIGAHQLVWASDSATSGVFWPMAGDTSWVARYTGAPRPNDADDWGSGW